MKTTSGSSASSASMTVTCPSSVSGLLRRGSLPTPRSGPSSETRADVQTYQIVIVDDDDLALGTLKRLVSYWGYDVVTFSRFEDARAFISTRTPDALVVDVRLGSYNGLQ